MNKVSPQVKAAEEPFLTSGTILGVEGALGKGTLAPTATSICPEDSSENQECWVADRSPGVLEHCQQEDLPESI